jgi:membrane protease YdiL (CAAX protease family)
MDASERAVWKAGTDRVPDGPGRLRLRVEMCLIFAVLPGLLVLVRGQVHGFVIPLILLAALLCLLYLLGQPGFPRRRLWNAGAFRHHLRRMLRVLLPLAALAALLSYLYDPARFLTFPRQMPVFWLLVMLLYPVLSAYPQELIYRAFFVQRYACLFRSERGLMLASALAFGWSHVFLGNWIAPVFATLGGLLFARTYLRSGSLLQAALEHGLWGDLLFTLGTGWYFYAGSIG